MRVPSVEQEECQAKQALKSFAHDTLSVNPRRHLRAPTRLPSLRALQVCVNIKNSLRRLVLDVIDSYMGNLGVEVLRVE